MMMTIVIIIPSKHWRKTLLELNHWNLQYLGKQSRSTLSARIKLREDQPNSEEVVNGIISIRIRVF